MTMIGGRSELGLRVELEEHNKTPAHFGVEHEGGREGWDFVRGREKAPQHRHGNGFRRVSKSYCDTSYVLPFCWGGCFGSKCFVSARRGRFETSVVLCTGSSKYMHDLFTCGSGRGERDMQWLPEHYYRNKYSDISPRYMYSFWSTVKSAPPRRN